MISNSPVRVADSFHKPELSNVPETAWNALAAKRIYFGHMSVGDNVVAGVEDIMQTNPQIRLRIESTSDPAEFDGPIFAHSHLGKNGDPYSKLHAFADLLDARLADYVNIAFFKFCYADVTAGTDVAALFAEYRETMDRLQRSHPQVTLVHVTVPLTVHRTGFKVGVMRLLGRPDDNENRSRFNDMLRTHCVGCAPLFDLARYEATIHNGVVERYDHNGLRVESLCATYTDDGGHLNIVGRQTAAEALLVVLARCVDRMNSCDSLGPVQISNAEGESRAPSSTKPDRRSERV